LSPSVEELSLVEKLKQVEIEIEEKKQGRQNESVLRHFTRKKAR